MDSRLLARAIEIADEASRDGRHGPFGAVVARGNEILGEGRNRVVEARDPTAHAEIAAIREAGLRAGTHMLEDCVIYCSCEPCPMCMAAIYWARIPRVVFAAGRSDAAEAGFDDALIQAESVLGPGDRSVEFQQHMRDASREVLRRWEGNSDRIGY
jgi:tRNA(Arg) A34 adenosine deaminase TadA